VPVDPVRAATSSVGQGDRAVGRSSDGGCLGRTRCRRWARCDDRRSAARGDDSLARSPGAEVTLFDCRGHEIGELVGRASERWDAERCEGLRVFVVVVRSAVVGEGEQCDDGDASGDDVRDARSSAPMTAARVFCSSRRSSASTTLRTTSRAVSRVLAGMTRLSESSVPTRLTSGSTASSSSGSSRRRWRSSRSIASFCMTLTTEDGKYSRMSPSQRATLGADGSSPAPRGPPRCWP
jgi:hypothetical protein